MKPNARRQFYARALNPIVPAGRNTFELPDSSTVRFPADFLLRGAPTRDPNRQAARLADQFLEGNSSRFRELDLEVEPRYDGARVELLVRAGIKIGAIPLLSPTTGRSDYGIVVRPRFAWTGIGEILGATGWRIIPTPLSLPLLPRSERKIPPWVLSTIIIARVEALLKSLERRFELIEQERHAPRGTVDWSAYARRQIGRSRFLNVPCRFPDLRDDRVLKAAIRFTLEKQIASLQTQLGAGLFVFKLIELCQRMMELVRDVAPRAPTPLTLQGWLGGRLATETFRAGIQAIEWTAHERGLAGLSDLQGLAWAMSMEAFFESWAETILGKVSLKIGGALRTQRQRQTLSPLNWSPPYLGSQKSLVPDIVLEREHQTVILDAKYKQHWEEMKEHRWLDLEKEVRERHRADLLQVLAYANLSTNQRTTVCLSYPCLEETWKSLRDRKQLFHRASVGAGTRRVDLVLTAFPMSTRVLPEVVDLMAREILAESE
jgi:5-methylcytosine-specific restriction endonuclease McrBC regulatory subunit McrC